VASTAIFRADAAGTSTLMVAFTGLSALGRDAVRRRFTTRSGRRTRVAGALLIAAGVVQRYLYLFRFGELSALRGLV
jgi:cytochrome c-type biogenesis protein